MLYFEHTPALYKTPPRGERDNTLKTQSYFVVPFGLFFASHLTVGPHFLWCVGFHDCGEDIGMQLALSAVQQPWGGFFLRMRGYRIIFYCQDEPKPWGYTMRMKPVGGKRESGFTLIEVIVIAATFAVLAAIAVPAFSVWGPKYRLKGSARDVYMAMGNAKSRAVRENARAVVIFSIPNDTYTVFIDDTPANWALDGAESVIYSGTVQDGVDIYGSTFPAHTYGYNGRGYPDVPVLAQYDVYMQNQNGQHAGVRVNASGALSIITSTDGGATWN